MNILDKTNNNIQSLNKDKYKLSLRMLRHFFSVCDADSPLQKNIAHFQYLLNNL